MAISLVTSTKAVGTSNSPAIDTSAATLLIIMQTFSAVGVATPTDSKGNTWTGLTAQNNAFNISSRLWYALSSLSVGSGHTVNAGGSTEEITMMAFTSSGAIVFDQQSGAQNFSPGSLTPANSDSLIVSGVGGGGGGASTWASVSGGGFSAITQVLSSAQGVTGLANAIAYVVQSGAGSASNPTWAPDAGSPFVNSHLAVFYESGGGPPPSGTYSGCDGTGCFHHDASMFAEYREKRRRREIAIARIGREIASGRRAA
jgi:hypothetical protein